MSFGWHCPTLLIAGHEGLSVWLAEQPDIRTVTVLADPAVAHGEITALVRAQIAAAGREDRLLVPGDAGDLPSAVALAGRLAGTDLVVGVGGGSLLDRAKLAALLGGPAARARLEVAQRGGLTVLPHDLRRTVRLVAVPTTLGTGSELSPVACLARGGGKRLVMGNALQPDVALLDPAATGTLPRELVAEGVLEVLFRIAGLYVGDHRDLPTEDALAVAMAEAAVRYGNEARDAYAAGRAPDAALRMEIAKLSGLSHQGWSVLGREPYCCRGWYVANELAAVCGVRKMTAVAALLPPLWQAIADGDARWGSARRLHALWGRLRATDPGRLPAAPADGIAALIDGWGIGRRIEAPGVAEVVARRSVRAWGSGLPMLGAFRGADIARLVERTQTSGFPVTA
jgi:NADP-dependent alcohol dehydrogenase